MWPDWSLMKRRPARHGGLPLIVILVGCLSSCTSSGSSESATHRSHVAPTAPVAAASCRTATSRPPVVVHPNVIGQRQRLSVGVGQRIIAVRQSERGAGAPPTPTLASGGEVLCIAAVSTLPHRAKVTYIAQREGEATITAYIQVQPPLSSPRLPVTVEVTSTSESKGMPN